MGVSLKKYVFGHSKFVTPTYNTYIGGVSESIGTASALAAKLGISAGDISNFSIVGSDIKCKVNVSYAMPYAGGLAFDNNASITYFYDYDGKCISLISQSFQLCPILTKVILNGVTTITGSSNFKDSNALKEIYIPYLTSCAGTDNFSFNNGTLEILYIPRCAIFGASPSVNNNNLSQNSIIKAKIYVTISTQTSNSGGVEADVAAVIAQGNTVRFVSNFTSPNPITDLSIGTIYNTALQMNFTAPTGSTNTIEFYEVYFDGLPNQYISLPSDLAIKLIKNTSYNITVVSVDIFLNKSIASNAVTQSTSNYTYDTDVQTFITNASISEEYQKDAAHLLTIGIKPTIWGKLKAIYPIVGGTASQHKFNLKNSLDTNAAFRLVFTGTLVHSLNGMKPAGGYANTFFNTLTENTQNNLSMSYYSRTNLSLPHVEMGGINSGAYLLFSYSGSVYKAFNSAQTIRGSLFTPTTGLLQGNRTSSTVERYYHRSVLKDTLTINSVTPQNGNIVIGGYNMSSQTTKECAFASIGEGLTDAEAVILNTAVELFQTILGRKV